MNLGLGFGDIAVSRIKVSSNAAVRWYLTTLPNIRVVSIEIALYAEPFAEEEGWIEPWLYIPDLTRFYDLEKVTIQFPGEVMTSKASGQLTLPNRVWMFALRNATLGSDLMFGPRKYRTLIALAGFLTRRVNLPSAIVDLIYEYWGEEFYHPHYEWDHKVLILLENASLAGQVNWHTNYGRNRDDLALMLWTATRQGNEYQFNQLLPHLEEDHEVDNDDQYLSDVPAQIRSYHDTRGFLVSDQVYRFFVTEMDRFDPTHSMTEMRTHELIEYVYGRESVLDPITEIANFLYYRPV